jgi:hypothetical protein
MMKFFATAFAASVLFQAGGGPAFAEDKVNDKAFDCPAFKAVIAAAPDGFASLRGALVREEEALAAYAVPAPLFGACEILDKKKIFEISYACQAENLSLADLKATIDSCLGETARRYAGNENPNSPYLRYDAPVAGRMARVLALKTFGKVTLAVFNPK